MPVERAELERLKYRKVEVEDVGLSVTVRDAVHAKTNHYIEQSRPYFPNEKLPTYIDCSNLLNFARGLCLLSLFGALAAGNGSVLIPVFFFLVCLAFIVIYCQHERVNQKSLPVVLKQPVFASQESNNAFYEVTVTDLDGIVLQNYQAGIGFVGLSRGKIRFQAFNTKAREYMTRAKCHSRVMLFLLVVYTESPEGGFSRV